IDVTNFTPQLRGIGWVPQEQLLFPSLNVSKNISYGVNKKLSREQRQDRISQVAEMLNIANLLNRDPTYLSGGEKQRVALARALAPEPKILLFDEPFNSLDVPERERLTLLFRSIQMQTGVTTVHVTHAPQEAEVISDKLFILSKGQILQSGTFDEMSQDPHDPEVARLLNVPNVTDLKKLDLGDGVAIIDDSNFLIHPNEKFQAKIIAKNRQKVFFMAQSMNFEISRQIYDGPIGSTFNFSIDPSKVRRMKDIRD
ncbi:MAG: ATP-binding cassette domain-containing protein, partial [Candidatus Heimdallarchaeota archaeon]|nr:ATP-binding cassette domain-containing protein [Candidatus Heimdallarchaeota archaeon]